MHADIGLILTAIVAIVLIVLLWRSFKLTVATGPILLPSMMVSFPSLTLVVHDKGLTIKQSGNLVSWFSSLGAPLLSLDDGALSFNVASVANLDIVKARIPTKLQGIAGIDPSMVTYKEIPSSATTHFFVDRDK